MPPRASATAEICLGAISIFVKLYSVATEKPVRLSRVHARCGGKLEQQYYCNADQAVVPSPEMARYFRHEDGTATMLADEEVKTAESDRIGTLEILECVPEDAVDPVYLGKTMFVAPNLDHGHDTYAHFVDALTATRSAAVGMHYSATRDQLVLILRYRERGLLLREIFYNDELAALDEIELPMSAREAGVPHVGFESCLAAIAPFRRDAFSALAYRNGYPDRLRLAAERKAAGVPLFGAARRASVLKGAREAIESGGRGRSKSRTVGSSPDRPSK
jgi:DNA end-binding protein Ku